jgi:hypothetical protein
VNDPHEARPEHDGCSCGAQGWTATLSCGHKTWAHGQAEVGGYIGCYPALGGGGCQASRKVAACEPGLPLGWGTPS